MTRRQPQDRRRPGTVVEQRRYPVGVELAERLAQLRFALPPADPRRLRRTARRKR